MRVQSPRFGGSRTICLLIGLLSAEPSLSAQPTREAAASPTPLAQRQPFIVGAFTDAYPYSYIDKDDKFVGFAVDVLDAVARAENLRFERVLGTGLQIRQRFQKGEFDLLQYRGVSSTTDTDFSVPFLSLQGCIFVRAFDSPIHDLTDFNGRSFGVIGSTGLGEKLLQDNNINAHVVAIASQDELLEKIATGEITGGFLSQLTELSITRRRHLNGIKMFGKPFHGYEVQQAFAVHKGDSELLARLNEGLAIVHRSGEYDRIYRKNFGQIGSYILTGAELELYVSIALALGLVGALWGYFRQRKLRKELSSQAAKLAEQGALLHALYDNIPLAMTVLETGPSGTRVLSMNRHAFGLYSVDVAAHGETLNSLPVSDDVRQHLLESIGRAPGDDAVTTREVKLKLGKRVLETTAVLLESPDDLAGARICVIVEDVTERRQQEAEIAQSRKLRAVGELVGGIAHEFNNLLTPVMLKAGEIQLSRPDDAELQDDVEVITQAVKRTAELTRRLLTFGRKVDQRAEMVRLEVIAAGCFDLLKNTVDRRISWENLIPDNLPPLYFNATDLNQILLNLLLNARDTLLEKLAHRSEPEWKARITVEAAQLPPESLQATGRNKGKVPLGWQRLTVRDNGFGMKPDVVERIFEPFFSTKEVGKGTGLGLATVWHLVTDAGGRVEVESIPEKGTVFNVYLPSWPAAALPPTISVSRAPAKTARVLLIEDESLVARPIMDILRRSGHQVRHIENGADAWMHLKANSDSYDLLIIDVDLPGMNGIDIVARAREHNFPGRIFMVSGRFTSSDMSELTRLRIDHALTKPFNAQQFVEAVNKSLDVSGG
jgi:two-component system, cell cycle sensor histidine kinase and response regulator CckA